MVYQDIHTCRVSCGQITPRQCSFVHVQIRDDSVFNYMTVLVADACGIPRHPYMQSAMRPDYTSSVQLCTRANVIFNHMRVLAADACGTHRESALYKYALHTR